MLKNLSKFGTSRGIIIPKVLLQLFGNPNQFTLDVEGEKIILTPVKKSEKKGA